jgi:hypothetical protein
MPQRQALINWAPDVVSGPAFLTGSQLTLRAAELSPGLLMSQKFVADKR